MKYYCIKVERVKEKETIYTFLKSKGYSENFIGNLRKDAKNIKLNGLFCNTRTKVKVGDLLQINESPNQKTQISPCNIPLNIVYEDDYILVVNKPAGISCMPNRSHYSNNLAGAIVSYMQQKDANFVLRIVNRLDKDTQGLIVVSKNAIVYNDLLKGIKKKYHAIVCGNINERVTIEKPILDEVNEQGIVNLKRVVNELGKPAKTMVTPLKHYKNHTLCEMELEFGRTHQIRVHLSNIGHPLFGDYLYGVLEKEYPHTALVCKSIEFLHPITKENIYLEVEYNEKFRVILTKL